MKELCKVTDKLETRINLIEALNNKLAGVHRSNSMKSSCSSSSGVSVRYVSNSAGGELTKFPRLSYVCILPQRPDDVRGLRILEMYLTVAYLTKRAIVSDVLSNVDPTVFRHFTRGE